MVRFLSTANSFISVMGLVTFPAKVIVLPSQASAMAWRKEPGPLSALLVTTGSFTHPIPIFWVPVVALCAEWIAGVDIITAIAQPSKPSQNRLIEFANRL